MSARRATETCPRAIAARFTTGAFALAAVSCGSPPPPAPKVPTPASAPANAEVVPVAEAPRGLPTACVPGDVCTFPPDVTERLCAVPNAEAALHLFGPKTPWKRAYLLRSFQAWHVGGHGELRELHTGEEVMVLSAGKTGGSGMQVGGRAFEVLRWDGTCVSLMEDELDFHRPPTAAPANIALKKLAPDYQAAFAEDKRIGALRASQERLCDAPIAEKEPGKTKCELARRQLSLAIAQAVGRGTSLPPLAFGP